MKTSCTHPSHWIWTVLPIAVAGQLGLASAQLSGSGPLPGDAVVAPATRTQEDPYIVPGNGMYLAVYEDERITAASTVGNDPWEPSHSDIYATRIAPDGSVIDTNPIIVDSSLYSQRRPRAAYNGSEWLVAFESRGALGFGTSHDIKAVRVSGNGEVLDTIPIEIDVTGAESFAPTVGTDGENWVVVWTNLGDLVGCTVDAAGNVGPTVTIAASAWAYDTSIAFAQGRYLLAWESGVTARMLDANLNFLSPELTLSVWAVDENPSVATDGNSFFVAWSYLDSIRPEVRGTQVLVDGTVVSPGGETLDAGVQQAAGGPGVAWNGSEYVVAWREQEYDWTFFTYDDQVVFNRFDSLGNQIGPGPTQIVGSAGLGSLQISIWRVCVASLGQGKSLCGWTDQRDGTKGYYGGYSTLIDSAGSFGPQVAYTVAPPAQLSPGLALGPEGASAAEDVNLAVFVSADAAETRVVFQRLDGKGVALDPEPVLLAGGKDTYEDTTVAWNGSLWLVVWEEQLVGNPGGQIVGMRVLPDGTILDPAPFVITPGHDPDLASIGQYFLVLGSNDPFHEVRSIEGVRVRGSDGAVLDASPLLIGSNYALAPSVASFSDRWLVAWHQHPTHDDPNSTVRAAFVLPSGVVQPQFSPTFTNLRENSADLVVVDNVATLAWSNRDDVLLRQILADGTLLGSPSGVPVVTGDEVTAPTIAWDDGRYLVSAVDYRNQSFIEPLLGDLYGTEVDAALQPLEPPGVPLAANPVQPEGEAAIRGRNGNSIVLFPSVLDGFGNWRISVGTWSRPPLPRKVRVKFPSMNR